MPEHLGEFEQLLLFALLRLDHSAHGVRIRQEIEARTGRRVSAGAIYTAMARLEKRGFVSSYEGDSVPARGGRRRRHYRIETDGAEALQRAYSQLVEMSEGVVDRLTAFAAPDRGDS